MSLYKWWCDSVYLVWKLAVKCAACSLFWLKRIFRFLFINHGWWWLWQPIIWFIFIPCILFYVHSKKTAEGETKSDQWWLLASIWLRMEEEEEKNTRKIVKWRKSNIQYGSQSGFTIQWLKGRSTVFQLCLCGKSNKMCVPLFCVCVQRAKKKHCYIVYAYLCVSVCEYWGRQSKEKRENSVYELQQYIHIGSAYVWIGKRMTSERSTHTHTKTVHFLLYI